MPSPSEVTQLLVNWSNGDRAALDDLMPFIHEELRRLARHYMRGEREGHTLQATALVNEAYMRLVDQSVPWQSRAHFFGISACLMRQILVDHARGHRSQKRGGEAVRVELEEAANVSGGKAAEMIALDEALQSLARLDPRRAQVVELRYFGGLSAEEIAEVLHVHPNTVTRDWTFARAWLHKELNRAGDGGGSDDDGVETPS